MTLSPREHQILAMSLDGLTAKEIARNLQISEGTVRWHQSGYIRKLGARNSVHAAAIAVRYNVV